MLVGLVDIGIGNLGSLKSALNKLNVQFRSCHKPEDFDGCNKFIVPGVGAFGKFMEKIQENHLDKKIIEVCRKKYPILGICVGFQILFEGSYEHGYHKGLNLLKGNFYNFQHNIKNLPIPHVGWNYCKLTKNKNKLFHTIEDMSDFYFTHSYFLKNYEGEFVLSTTNYDIDFVSSINKNNIFGVQFHPEKSQKNGLNILKNFVEIC